MKNKSPAFQFYPKDYLSDINVQIMSLSERGAYMSLLCHEWLEGGLPNDDDMLSILSGLGKEWFGKSGEKIKKCFTIKSGNFINPRLEKERKNQKDRRKKRSDAGKKGNKTRWGKDSNGIVKGSQCDNNAIAKDRSTTTSSTTPTSLKNKDIYIIFDFWNSQGITKHKTIDKSKPSINAAIKEYSEDEIKKAIINYNTILNDSTYYWTHKWTLKEFLQRGMDKFRDENNPFDNYKADKKGDSRGENQGARRPEKGKYDHLDK